MGGRTDRRKGERRQHVVPAPKEQRSGLDRRSLDRRQSVRAPMDLWMEEAHGEDVYFRRVGNLSLGGVFFENTIPHTPGTRVTLKFSVPGQERIIEAQGVVVTTTADKNALGMGVRFTSLDGQDRKLIETYILEVQNGSHADQDASAAG